MDQIAGCKFDVNGVKGAEKDGLGAAIGCVAKPESSLSKSEGKKPLKE